MSPQILPIYLINIDRATERLAEIRRQSAEFSIEINRVEGIDGSLLAREQWVDIDERLFLRRHGRHILPGEYGCYRSHVLALERMLADGADAAIIIEDDVLMDREFLARAAAAKEAAPDADVIKLVNHRWKGFRALAQSNEGDREKSNHVLTLSFAPQQKSSCCQTVRPVLTIASERVSHGAHQKSSAPSARSL